MPEDEKLSTREAALVVVVMNLTTIVRDLSNGWPERELHMPVAEALQDARDLLATILPEGAEVP